MLSRRVAILVRRVISSKAEDLQCRLLALGGTADHVHLLLRLPATRSVADVVHHLKGASSHLITHCADGEPAFKWQGGYAAISVSPQSVATVVRYIRGQAEHHRDGTAEDAWELG